MNNSISIDINSPLCKQVDETYLCDTNVLRPLPPLCSEEIRDLGSQVLSLSIIDICTVVFDLVGIVLIILIERSKKNITQIKDSEFDIEKDSQVENKRKSLSLHEDEVEMSLI